jgi:hypothetical protein
MPGPQPHKNAGFCEERGRLLDAFTLASHEHAVGSADLLAVVGKVTHAEYASFDWSTCRMAFNTGYSAAKVLK